MSAFNFRHAVTSQMFRLNIQEPAQRLIYYPRAYLGSNASGVECLLKPMVIGEEFSGP